MSKSLVKNLTENLEEALEEVTHELKKAGAAISDETRDNFARAAADLNEAAQTFVTEARKRSEAVARGAVAEVKEHPMATAAIAAAAAALIGLAIAKRFEPAE
ncbi:MAG: hypothetical protein ACK41C_19190 [Phenylobacterium sp.]|uniref:hypothetical protein n=1 Tax=Phenylobacterium sp. TaxID=1871053 RepID=UPI00391B2BC1